VGVTALPHPERNIPIKAKSNTNISIFLFM
jgi:hypothetical protein